MWLFIWYLKVTLFCEQKAIIFMCKIYFIKFCIVGRVENYYLKSDWIGHKRGQDILKSFTNSTEDLPMKFCINIGLDNVSSNKVFLGAYEEIRKALELLGLIETGPCFLHGLNRGLINAHKHTDLGVSEFLEGINHSFKKSSSRIEDLLSVSTTKLLPLPYCATRFVENIGPTKRALVILPDLKKYVKKFQPSKEDTKKREKLGKNVSMQILNKENPKSLWLIQSQLIEYSIKQFMVNHNSKSAHSRITLKLIKI